MAKFFTKHKPKQRWLLPYYGGSAIATTSSVVTIGRVFLIEFEVQHIITVDQIVWINGAAVSGNVRAGIYGPITTEETANASPLVYDSGDVVQTGINSAQAHTLSTTKILTPGRYYAALELDNGTGTFMRQGAQNQVLGWTQYYDRGGGYGALTNPCPAPTNSAAIVPGVRLRCVV